MKHFTALLLVFGIGLSLCIANIITDNGKPGCKTEREILVQKYRNFWDPSKYWLCLLHGVPATSANCEPEFLYQDEVKKCIHHTEWLWTPPVNPPSKP